MVLLCVDSSAGSSAALVAREEILGSFSHAETFSHAEVLAPGVTQLLKDAALTPQQLSGVVIGVGPGPFTGLRVGIAFAQSVALALELPLYGICSLDSLAIQAQRSGIRGEILAVTDARRREVYWSQYQLATDWPQLIQGPFVSPAQDCPAITAVGPGAQLYPQQLRSPAAAPHTERDPGLPKTSGRETATAPAARNWLPRAADLGVLAAAQLAGQLSGMLRPTRPLYLRESDAKVPAHMAGPR